MQNQNATNYLISFTAQQNQSAKMTEKSPDLESNDNNLQDETRSDNNTPEDYFV